jgi:hypothetical protein
MRQGGAEDLPRDRWAEAHNLSFADHWRFAPRDEDKLMAGGPRPTLLRQCYECLPGIRIYWPWIQPFSPSLEFRCSSP